jgi:branched-chain amino acid transport system permease protein
MGLRLRAAREDEYAARSVGIRVFPERYVAFVLSAFLVGAAGFLYAQFLTSFTADEFFVQLTFLTIAMLVVGGINSLSGAVIGTVVVSVIAELLRRVEQGVDLGVVSIPDRPGIESVGLALLMLVILIFRPQGITGGREITLGRPRGLPRARAELPLEHEGSPT